MAVERVVLTSGGVKIVQLVTDDPDGAVPALPVGVEFGEGLGADPAEGPALWWRVRAGAVA